MSSWTQPQQMNNNNMMMGQAQFSPYNGYGYNNIQPRIPPLPVYKAEPIHGANAAWQFSMGPNSEIYLPDADQDIIWWIRTDANGNKTVTPFDVNVHEEPKQVNMNDVLARLTAVEEWINGKQNKSNAKRNATAASVSAGPESGSN